MVVNLVFRGEDIFIFIFGFFSPLFACRWWCRVEWSGEQEMMMKR